MTSESDYIELNKMGRHDLVTECLRLSYRTRALEKERDQVSNAVAAHLNKGLSAQDAINLVRKALFPGWNVG